MPQLINDARLVLTMVYLLVGFIWVSTLRLKNGAMSIGEMLVNLILWPIAVLVAVLRIEI